LNRRYFRTGVITSTHQIRVTQRGSAYVKSGFDIVSEDIQSRHAKKLSAESWLAKWLSNIVLFAISLCTLRTVEASDRDGGWPSRVDHDGFGANPRS